MLPGKVLRKVFYIQAIVALMISVNAHGQLYPVQVTPQLVPPYSVYLSDYASSGSEKLRVIVLQRDLSRPAYQIRLVMNVEWNGKVIMRTSRAFNPPPLNLSPGIPTVISGAELASYLDSRNIDFVGYSREQYERTRALPEGSYRISFTAYDYSRQDVQVSAVGNSFYYLAKSEPPLINYPSCGTKIPSKTPQQIIFSWLPRNTASPNSALETEYEFSLYETRPAGRNPNDVVLTTQPVFRTRTQFTQLIYGPAEPVLLPDITYVWRVQAIDRNGKDAFRNNGYSEVCTFFYSSTAAPFEIGMVKDFQAVGETENRGKISWTAGDFDSYRAEYKKAGQGFEWFKSDIKDAELKIFDLEPDTEYEARVQARKSGYFGPFTDVVKFRTLPARVAHCGENPGLPDINNPGSPLTDAITGMTVNARGQEMVLTQITQGGGDGWYAGYGKVTLKYLGASYPVKFDRIFINDNREVVLGRINVLTNGTTHLVEAQVASVKADRVKENREEWKDTEFHEEVFEYDDIEIADVLIDDVTGIITITDAAGNTITNDEITPILVDAPEKAVIIEDKNGDQWVVEKDKSTGKTKVTRVEGGGLQPDAPPVNDADALDMVKKALRELRTEFTDTRISQTANELQARRQELAETIEADNNKFLVPSTAPVSVITPQSFLFDFEEIEGEQSASETEFDRLSKVVKTLELELNTGNLIRLMADNLDKRDDHKVVARELKIDERSVSDFVTAGKAKNTSEDDMVKTISIEIKKLIEEIFVRHSLSNK